MEGSLSCSIAAARRKRLRQSSDRLKNLRVGGPFLVIGFDNAPTDDSLGIDDISRRVGPAFAARIENAIAVDHLVASVLEKRKVEIAGKSLLEFLHKLFGIVVTVDTHRK